MGVMRVLVSLLGLSLVACGTLVPLEDDAHPISEGFVFIRDEAGLLPPGQVRQTEELLRSMAERTGVFGVVVSAEAIDDPTGAANAIVESVVAAGGEALIGFCTPDDCALQTASAVSDGIKDAASMVAPAPEPAPGQGVPRGARGLRAWVEFVGAVTTLPEAGS